MTGTVLENDCISILNTVYTFFQLFKKGGKNKGSSVDECRGGLLKKLVFESLGTEK